MAKFDRKVKRNKKEYQFTKKEIKSEKKNWKEFRENFGLKWMKLNWKSLIFLVIDFFAVNIIFVPLLMQYFDSSTAFVLGNGALTSLFIVLTFYLLASEKPGLLALLTRYCFMALLLAVASFISVSLI